MRPDQWLTVPSLLPSTEEMSEMDRRTINAGIASSELMERAGTAIAAHIEMRYNSLLECSSPVILAGPGNNGGDGFVIARLLSRYKPKVILASAATYSDECRSRLQELDRDQIEIFLYGDQANPGVTLKRISDQDVLKLVNDTFLIIDALLGTGQKAAPRGAIGELLSLRELQVAISSEERTVIAVDVPTGCNATTGAVYMPAIRATETVSIEFIKRGLMQYPARGAAGKISCVSIGINQMEVSTRIVTAGSVTAPVRKAEQHKGNAGHCLVIAGSRRMPGAASLCSRAALRSGAGLVTKAVISGSAAGGEWPEVMWMQVEESEYFTPSSLLDLKPAIEAVETLIIGPGLGRAPATEEFLNRLLAETENPAVIDADGLNLLSVLLSKGSVNIERLKNCILTPHPGEAASLLGIGVASVQRDRFSAINALVQKTGAACILKGAGSLVAAPGTPVAVVPYGNPSMATAGSGDVLSGVCGAFLANGLLPVHAAIAASVLHAVAGDRVYNRHHGPLIASDILEALPEVIGEWYNMTFETTAGNPWQLDQTSQNTSS